MLSKTEIPFKPFYFPYPHVKLLFAKPFSFYRLRFIICFDVKPTTCSQSHTS